MRSTFGTVGTPEGSGGYVALSRWMVEGRKGDPPALLVNSGVLVLEYILNRISSTVSLRQIISVVGRGGVEAMVS